MQYDLLYARNFCPHTIFENVIYCFQYKIIYLDIYSDIFNVMQLFLNINQNKVDVTRKVFGSL